MEVASSAPMTPAPVPEPELVPDVVVEEEPRPTTTKVAGTKQLGDCELRAHSVLCNLVNSFIS